jgi:phage terminase large subunit
LTNWQEREFDVGELIQRKLEPRFGMDLGWVDPTAAVFTLYDKENKTIYIYDEFYKSGVQLDKVADALREKGVSRHIKLWVDSAEPRTIDFLRQSGFNAIGSIKGPDSVFAGISFLQNMKIVVKPCCKNIITELSNFSYIKDKKTNKYSDKMTHEYSHAIDALRYCYSDIYTRRKLTTIDKSMLGL